MIEESDVLILTDSVTEAVCPKCSHKMDVQGLPSFSSLICAQCGHEMTVPARLGHFLLRKIIGMGGMGGVYRAHDEVLNRAVAIKVMRKSLGDNTVFSETFLREAQAAARINHPNIVQIYSFGKEKGQPYIVMELVLGGGLDTLMEAGQPLDQKLILRIAEQVADGLRHASDEGMMHGDVKPENILLAENRMAKLVDFGLASVSGTASNEIWGTPFYIAPEKVRRQSADHRADIYSLGGTLYHALAAQPPFDGPDANAVVRARFAETLKPLNEIRPDIDPQLSAIISRMLLNEPSLRYPTYGSLLSDIRQVSERLGPEEQAAPPSKKIILRRKGSNKVKPASNAAAGGEKRLHAPVPSEKKIVIGRGVMVASGHQSSVLTGNLADGLGEEAEAAPPAPDDPAKRMRLVKLIATLVVVGLLVLVGGLFGLVKWRQAYVASKETEQQQQENVRQNAVFSLRGVAERAKQMNEHCVAEAEKAETLAKAFVLEVTDLLPEEVRPYLIPPRPLPPPVVEEPDLEQIEDPAAKSVPDDPALKAKVYAAVITAGLQPTPENIATYTKAAAIVIAADLQPTPENIAMFAKAAAASAATTGDKAPDTAATGAPAPEAEQMAVEDAVAPEAEATLVADAGDSEAAPPLDITSLPPIVQRVRSMFESMYQLKLAAEVTAVLAEEIEMALQVPNIEKYSLERAQTLHAELTEKCDVIATRSPVADVDRLQKGIEADHQAALGLLSDLKMARDRQEKEILAREAGEAAAMEKQRQEQERRDLIQGELGSVTAVEAMNVDLLRTLEFRQAVRALNNLDFRLQTNEGKTALAVAKERVTRIEAFYTFLGTTVDGVPDPATEEIDADRPLPAFRHPAGWMIEKSDAKGVTVKGKQVGWGEVDDLTKVMMIRFLLQDNKQVTALRFRYRIQQYINAALFLETFIINSPVVKKIAVSLAQEAITMFPHSREDIDRLMPRLLQPEE